MHRWIPTLKPGQKGSQPKPLSDFSPPSHGLISEGQFPDWTWWQLFEAPWGRTRAKPCNYSTWWVQKKEKRKTEKRIGRTTPSLTACTREEASASRDVNENAEFIRSFIFFPPISFGYKCWFSVLYQQLIASNVFSPYQDPPLILLVIPGLVITRFCKHFYG